MPNTASNAPKDLSQATHHLGQGNHAAARQEIENLLATHPEHREAFLFLVDLFLQTNEVNEAFATLLRAETLLADDPIFPQIQGRLFHQLGQHEKADEAFRRASERPAITSTMLSEWARVNVLRGRLSEALPLYKKALERDPTDVVANTEMIAVQQAIVDSENRVSKYLEFLNAKERFPIPYAGFAGKPLSAHHNGTHLDAWGFPNDAPPPPTKAPNETRVFILGDSTMFGSEEGIHKTVPARVKDLIHAHGHTNVSIYNFGVVSSCATQMLALLFFKLMDYDPDYVVVICGGTDIFSPLSYDPRPGYPYNFYVTEELYTRFFDFDQQRDENARVGSDDLLQAIALRQTDLRAQVGIGQSAEWEVGVVHAFGDFLSKLDKLAIGYNLDVSVVLQPLVNTKVPLAPSENALCRPETFAYFQRQYERFQTLLFPDGQKPGQWGNKIALHDATNVFSEQHEEIYTDFIHYNNKGKELMAARLAEVVINKLNAGKNTHR